LINKLIDLGHSIETKAIKDTISFADHTNEILKDFKIEGSLKDLESDISKWMMESKLPTQLNVYNSFGQPPITVFNNGDFVIDLYFWMHADTSIHGHSFSGAFKVLYGRSVHELYEVKTKTSYSHDVETTDIERVEVDVLRPGDSKKILPGDMFHHRVVHLDNPTVTLCIRTCNDKTIPQWHHFENGLSILKRELDESIYKKLFYFDYLYSKNESAGIELLDQFLKSIDSSEAMNLFEQLTVDTMGISEASLDYFYNTFMEYFQGNEWFSLYEQYCVQAEDQVQPNSNSASDKFLAHAHNTNYSQMLIDKIILDIS
jgi:hypothetical protein